MRGNECYFCERPATSKEHVPPKMMFKGQACDSITVPACASHNQDKSVEDRAIIHGFLLGILNSLSESSPTQRILAAALKAEQDFYKTKHTTQNHPIFPGGPQCAHITIPPNEWIHQITAGLVYHALQRFEPTIQWDKAQSFSQSYMSGTTSTPIAAKLNQIEEIQEIVQSLNPLQWLNGWTPKPRPWPSDLYSFQFYPTPKITYVKHKFFESYEWYVAFSHTPAISTALTQKASP